MIKVDNEFFDEIARFGCTNQCAFCLHSNLIQSDSYEDIITCIHPYRISPKVIEQPNEKCCSLFNDEKVGRINYSSHI